MNCKRETLRRKHTQELAEKEGDATGNNLNVTMRNFKPPAQKGNKHQWGDKLQNSVTLWPTKHQTGG